MAWRYLFSRKSHSAVNVIAIVSVCGVAVATMAIVCVLSVFNGFHDVILSRDSRITPDVEVTAADAPCIDNADSLLKTIRRVAGVRTATPIVADNAVAYRGARQIPVNLLGVEAAGYRRATAVDSLLWRGSRFDVTYAPAGGGDGTQTLTAQQSAAIEHTAAAEFDEDALFADIADPVTETAENHTRAETPAPMSVVSVGVADRLGLTEGDGDGGIVLFVPRRTATLNVANPAASFMADSIGVSGIIESDQSEFDSQTIIVDIELARRLLEYTSEATAVYVSGADPSQSGRLAERIRQTLGPHYLVRDRMEQQTVNFRMISIEKWVTFLLLSFILIIASFNIISTLSMLIVEKRGNISTLSRIGASRRFIGDIFFWESIIVCLIGTIAGIALGICLCLLQQHFGLIQISGDPGTLIVSDYPVSVQLTDIVMVLLPSGIIAVVTGWISSRFARRMAG